MYKDPAMGGNGALRASLCSWSTAEGNGRRGAIHRAEASTRIALFTPWSSGTIRVCKQEEGRLVRAELWSDDVTHVSNALSRCKGTRATAARKQATGGVSFGWEATAFTVGDHRNETERVLHYPTGQPHSSHGSLGAPGAHSFLCFSAKKI